MKNMLKILPLVAFLLAMTAAFADRTADDEVATKQALITVNGVDEWEDIDKNAQQGVDYLCEEEPNRQCTRSFNAQGQLLPDMAEFGRYIP